MKRIATVILTAAMLTVALCVNASAKYEPIAEALAAVGMFRGTDKGFELDRAPTRAEAAIMLTRLYGAEEEANSEYQAGKIKHPFQDVSDYTSPYVAWLYANDIIKGTSSDTFDSQKNCTMVNYIVFLLRALGYQDGTDFRYADALSFAAEKGIKTSDITGDIFTRDDLALLTCRGLSAYLKGETAPNGTILYFSLERKGLIDADQSRLLFRYIAASLNGTEEIAPYALPWEQSAMKRWKAVVTGQDIEYIATEPDEIAEHDTRPNYRVTWLPDGWALKELKTVDTAFFGDVVQIDKRDVEWDYSGPDGETIEFQCRYPDNKSVSFDIGSQEKTGYYIDINGCQAELYGGVYPNGDTRSLLTWETEEGVLCQLRANNADADILSQIARSARYYDGENINYAPERIPTGYHEKYTITAAGYQQTEWQNREGTRLVLLAAPEFMRVSDMEPETIQEDDRPEIFYQPPVNAPEPEEEQEKPVITIDGEEMDASSPVDVGGASVTVISGFRTYRGWDYSGIVSWRDPETGLYLQLRGMLEKSRLIQIAYGVTAKK